MYVMTSGYGSGSGSGSLSNFNSSYSNRNNYTTSKNRNMILLFILIGITLSFGICLFPLLHTKCSRLYYRCNIQFKKIYPTRDEVEDNNNNK